MSGLVLLAQAIEAERDADTIFAAMAAARRTSGCQAHVPVGWHDRAEKASDLRRRARWLRARAAGLDHTVTNSAAATAERSPSPASLSGPAASATRHAPDPVEVMAAEIIAAANNARGHNPS